MQGCIWGRPLPWLYGLHMSDISVLCSVQQTVRIRSPFTVTWTLTTELEVWPAIPYLAPPNCMYWGLVGNSPEQACGTPTSWPFFHLHTLYPGTVAQLLWVLDWSSCARMNILLSTDRRIAQTAAFYPWCVSNCVPTAYRHVPYESTRRSYIQLAKPAE